jgi:glycerate 2-kinase
VTTVPVAGRSLLSAERLHSAGITRAYRLADEPDVDKSMANAAALLHDIGQRIATDWLALRI